MNYRGVDLIHQHGVIAGRSECHGNPGRTTRGAPALHRYLPGPRGTRACPPTGRAGQCMGAVGESTQAPLSDEAEPVAHLHSGSLTASFGQRCQHACWGGGHLVAAVHCHIGAVVVKRRVVRVIEEAPQHVIPDVVLHVEQTCGGAVPNLSAITHALPALGHLQHPGPSLRLGYRLETDLRPSGNPLSARRSPGHGVGSGSPWTRESRQEFKGTRERMWVAMPRSRRETLSAWVTTSPPYCVTTTPLPMGTPANTPRPACGTCQWPSGVGAGISTCQWPSGAGAGISTSPPSSGAAHVGCPLARGGPASHSGCHAGPMGGSSGVGPGVTMDGRMLRGGSIITVCWPPFMMTSRCAWGGGVSQCQGAGEAAR